MGLDVVSVIVLAAGAARRFGAPKQLGLLGDKTLLEWAERRNRSLESLLSPPGHVLRSTLVLGAHHDQVLPHVTKQEWSRVVQCESWQAGMCASLNAGFEAARQDASGKEASLRGVIVCLIDQPLVSADSLRRLIDAGLSRCEISCARYDDGIGTPAYFPYEELERFSTWYKELTESEEHSSGAKRFILSRPHHAISLGQELVDIDTQEDLVRLNNQVAQDLPESSD